VTVNNVDEELWLQQTFGASEGYWIGLNDERVEGQFEWASGETVSYTNFASSPPDDFGDDDYMEMGWAFGTQWDDDEHDTFQGVIEIKYEAGNDVLFGNSGNDFLNGEDGDDVLNGSSFEALGAYERDTLVGGLGSDRFILGNSVQAFYSAAGNGDYALIKDFKSAEDELQLHGAVSDYSQHRQGGNVLLYYHGSTFELVAVLENLFTELDLNTVAQFS
ncbi:MAG: hypothetical protein F6K16_39360, partial [Symploca sp. SIO2B6]|nr:hypothetical protein [Symploca sp. SIO2B6]